LQPPSFSPPKNFRALETVCFPCRADPASEKQHINAAARAEIEHDFIGFQFHKSSGVATPKRGFDGCVWNLIFLLRIVEV
jgi:hypothetical protein